MRGKDCKDLSILEAVLGSPPLARERLKLACEVMNFTRITPACAGKTNSITILSSCWRDHPRLRGKDVLHDFAIKTNLGSPPLARERRPMPLYGVPGLRITPACAGKTQEFYLGKTAK